MCGLNFKTERKILCNSFVFNCIQQGQNLRDELKQRKIFPAQVAQSVFAGRLTRRSSKNNSKLQQRFQEKFLLFIQNSDEKPSRRR